MGKKKAFAKGGGANKSNAVNGIFKVSGVQQKKKPKAVKTQIKKVIFYFESNFFWMVLLKVLVYI